MSAVRLALQRRSKVLGSRHRGEEGFGLIECIVAMVCLLAVLIPTAYFFSNVLGQAATARQRLTALSVAEQWIETLNNSGPPTDTNDEPEVGINLNEGSTPLSGITYKVNAEFNWTDQTGGTPDFCSSGTSPVLGLQVTVSWVGNQSITDQAILNFPASGDLTSGYLAVQVDGDPAGSPPAGPSGLPWSTRVTSVPVEVSGSALTSSYSLNPPADGCVFLEVPPGTYTVQVGPGPNSNYVANYNESTSETQALSNQSPIEVVAAEISSVTFQYDWGSDVDLSYPSTTSTDDGISCPNTSIVTCLAMGQAASSPTSPATTPVAVGIVKKGAAWSVASFPSSMTRIEGVACTSAPTCIAVGYSSSGGAAAVSTDGTSWSNSALPSGVGQLTSIVCPTGATTLSCVAIGTDSTNTTGVLLTGVVSGSTVTWTNDKVPSNTALTSIACPSTTAQPICFVAGATSSSAATIISNTGQSSPGTTWKAFKQSGITMSTIASLVCNSPTFCMASGTGAVSSSVVPEIISITKVSNKTVTWEPFTASGFTMSTLTSLACTTTGDSCWAAGTGQIGTGAIGPMIVYCDTSSASLCVSGTKASTWENDTVPS
ncbi:MAG: type IV pilus modification PilV family protein, partial [Acidimicrobiales bacterium]